MTHPTHYIGDGPGAEWLKAHFDFPHKDWCLIWPFSRSQTGYAMFGADNKFRAHRVMCEHRHGPAPSPDHYAAHSCDRGHEGCVNPWHLDWKTPSENQFDRYKTDEPRQRWKLTPEQAKEIRELKGLERIQDTAARYAINESNVRLIQAGKTWRQDRRGIHIFTREEVARIRSATPERGMVPALAKEFGVSTSAIYRIRIGKSHQHFDFSEAAE
jgi:hypothetical protein